MLRAVRSSFFSGNSEIATLIGCSLLTCLFSATTCSRLGDVSPKLDEIFIEKHFLHLKYLTFTIQSSRTAIRLSSWCNFINFWIDSLLLFQAVILQVNFFVVFSTDGTVLLDRRRRCTGDVACAC